MGRCIVELYTYPSLFPRWPLAQDCRKEVVKIHILCFLLPDGQRLSLQSPGRLILRCSFRWYLFNEEPGTNLPIPPDSTHRILMWASHGGKTHCLLDVILVLTQAKRWNLPGTKM